MDILSVGNSSKYAIWGGVALALLVAIILVIVYKVAHSHAKKAAATKAPAKSLGDAVDKQVDHIFDDEFREELRNRGRLHFEKIIGENAMFLQQDLRLTTSQLNEYMKSEITRKLQEEFSKYEESIMDAKKLAVDAIEKTNTAIDEQRTMLSAEIQKQVAEEKDRLVAQFETDMARIVNHYVLEAIGDQIDLSDQLNYIISELEANKKEIIKDISNG